jgi:quercetin dioxygenase-like cupin family protein
MSSTDHLPAAASVQRAADAERVPFSPTQSMRFVADGGPGLPEMYEEHGARGDAVPLHRHPWPSWELVIEGHVRVSLDGQEERLGPGDSVYIPAGMPHAYVIESDVYRAVGIGTSDGRFPSLQRRAAPLMLAQDGPPMDQIVALVAEHGAEVLGPPMSLDEAAPA